MLNDAHYFRLFPLNEPKQTEKGVFIVPVLSYCHPSNKVVYSLTNFISMFLPTSKFYKLYF